MTGAKNFYTNGNDLCFTIGRNKSKANRVKICLNVMDTYDIEFIKFTNDRLTKDFQYIEAKFETLDKIEDIYNDNLTEVFERYTGLYTRL
jgi:hypothetical protein